MERIAIKAGVSSSTVFRWATRRHRTRADKLAKIEAAAREMGIKPPARAGIVARG